MNIFDITQTIDLKKCVIMLVKRNPLKLNRLWRSISEATDDQNDIGLTTYVLYYNGPKFNIFFKEYLLIKIRLIMKFRLLLFFLSKIAFDVLERSQIKFCAETRFQFVLFSVSVYLPLFLSIYLPNNLSLSYLSSSLSLLPLG